MSRDNNLTNHEVYDSFFATDKQKKEFDESGFGRGFLYFFICVIIALLFGFIEYSIFGTVAGGFNICIAAGIIVFFFALKIIPWGYLSAISSVIIACLALVIMIGKAGSGVNSIDDHLALPFAIAAVSLILSVPNIIMETVVRVKYNKSQKKKKTLKKNIVKIRVSLVIIAGIGCLTALVSFCIGIYLSFTVI